MDTQADITKTNTLTNSTKYSPNTQNLLPILKIFSQYSKYSPNTQNPLPTLKMRMTKSSKDGRGLGTLPIYEFPSGCL
jgi:hypothetical protein